MTTLNKAIRAVGLISFLLISTTLFATTRLSSDQLFEVESGSGRFVCGLVSNKWIPGSLTKSGDFQSLAEQISVLRTQIKKATGAKKTKLQKKSNTLRKLRETRARACAGGPPSGNATPTPESIVTNRPTPTSTARPTMSATPSNRCFDSAGNTTCFGIPAGMHGNKNSGSVIVSSDCLGCHNERQNRTYQQIVNSINSVSQMSRFVDLPSQDIADIVAYINRFNTQ